MTFKVIIAGARTFDDYPTLVKFCDSALSNKTNIEVVSGGCHGADLLGEAYAEERNYPITRFIPDWNKYDKRAGPIRNAEMANYADALICFWDNSSRGTRNMIQVAELSGLAVRVFKY